MNAPLSTFRHKNLIYSIFSYLFLCFVVGTSSAHNLKILHISPFSMEGGGGRLRELCAATHFLNWYLCILLASCNSSHFSVDVFVVVFYRFSLALLLNNKQRTLCILFGSTAIQAIANDCGSEQEAVWVKQKKSVINKFSNRFKNTFVVYCISVNFSYFIRQSFTHIHTHTHKMYIFVADTQKLCNQLGICQWNN